MIKKLIAVKVIPRASANEVVKMEDGSLKVRLTKPPVDGEANGALVKLLSDYFSVAQSQINIVKGRNSRQKLVEIESCNL